MEYFTEQASTYPECLSKIREKYGDGVQILIRKTVRVGGFLGFFAREGVEITGIIPQRGVKSAVPLAAAANGAPLPVVPAETGLRKPLDFEEEKKKLLAVANPARDLTLQMVLSEVRNLSQKMDAAGPATGKGEDHPSIGRIEELLVLNDFSPPYRRNMLDRIRKELSLEALEDFDALQDRVVEWIGESITICGEEKFQRSPRIMVLVGPSGVGKTTTVAKLAAVFGIPYNGRPALEVRLLTIDGYRIGARAQIEAYGGYMNIPVHYVDDYEGLRKTIAMNSEGVDLILVDTIGKSPRDSARLGEMKQFLDACGSFAEIYLTMAATTKTGDLEEILRQFEPFNYKSVIITKLDETSRVGNVISVLSERGKSVSYITDGQKVPSDIQKASAVRFLLNLEGFKINRGKIEARFPQDSSEKNQWR